MDISRVERHLLSHLITDHKVYIRNSRVLTDSLFNDGLCKEIFSTYKQIIDEGKRPTDVSIARRMSGNHKNIFSELAEIKSEIDYGADVDDMLKFLRDSDNNNQLTQMTHDIKRMIAQNYPNEEIISLVQDYLMKMTTTNNIKDHSINSIADSLLEQIEKNRTREGLTGIGTGIESYDGFTGGLQKTDLIIIAAETSQGKTSLALTMAVNAVIDFNAKVVFFSYEMSDTQLLSRIVSQKVEINSKKISLGKLSDEQVSIIKLKLNTLRQKNLYIDECSSTNLSYLANQIRMYKLMFDVDVVIVDYLQLVSNNKKNMNVEAQAADVSRTLKNLARELDINVIALSQLSRDRNSHEPTLSRLRNSGQLEESCDQALLIYRPEVFGINEFNSPHEGESTMDKARITIAKGRNVGMASFLLGFNAGLTKFYNLNEYESQREINESPF